MTRDTPYFDRAESWAIDTQVRASRSRRTAWIVAAIAVALALFEAIALAMLAPLKTVQPITLLVDRQTGFVQAIDPVSPRRVTADAALTQSFLAQYVAAREGFDRGIADVDYRKVALWSAGRARADYVAMMPAANPASPFQRYPAGSTVSVRVKSVSRLSQNVAFVRFDTQRRDSTGRTEPAQSWVAVVRYRYTDAAMAIEDRMVNPLGFQVTDYRRDAEVVAAPTPTPVALAAAAPGPAQAVASQPRVPADRPVVLVTPRDVRVVPANQVPMGSPLVGAAR